MKSLGQICIRAQYESVQRTQVNLFRITTGRSPATQKSRKYFLPYRLWMILFFTKNSGSMKIARKLNLIRTSNVTTRQVIRFYCQKGVSFTFLRFVPFNVQNEKWYFSLFFPFVIFISFATWSARNSVVFVTVTELSSRWFIKAFMAAQHAFHRNWKEREAHASKKFQFKRTKRAAWSIRSQSLSCIYVQRSKWTHSISKWFYEFFVFFEVNNLMIFHSYPGPRSRIQGPGFGQQWRWLCRRVGVRARKDTHCVLSTNKIEY